MAKQKKRPREQQAGPGVQRRRAPEADREVETTREMRERDRTLAEREAAERREDRQPPEESGLRTERESARLSKRREFRGADIAEAHGSPEQHEADRG